MTPRDASSRDADAGQGRTRPMTLRSLGLPFALIAVATLPFAGATACVTATTIALLATFIVFIPVTVIVLNNGALDEAASEPPLTPRAYGVILTLWTVTVWCVALSMRLFA
jgi:hypothetical protein